MPRSLRAAVAVCLCLSSSAVAARGQDGSGGTTMQDASPARHGGKIESADADWPSALPRRPPTTIYTEEYESPEEIIRRAQTEAEQWNAEFAPADPPPAEPRPMANPFADAFDSTGGSSSGFDPNDVERGDPPGVPRTATRFDYLDPPRPTPVERNWIEPDQFLLPNMNEPPPRSAWLEVDRVIDRASARLLVTALPGSGNDVGLTEVDVSGRLTIARAPGLWIAPGFGTVFTDGPTRTDLPPQLYNARLEVGYKYDFAPHFNVSLSIAPGIYSDFEQSSSDAWRVLGKAVGFFAFSEQTQAIFGVAYLDREDVRALPIIGIIHSPSHLWRLEFVFPQPRFAYRILDGDASSTWVYLGGEFGGDTWAVERTTGRNDIVTYSDWRLKFGIEWKAESGRQVLLETGYVFNRELEYRSRRGDFDPSSTAMLRFGVTY